MFVANDKIKSTAQAESPSRCPGLYQTLFAQLPPERHSSTATMDSEEWIQFHEKGNWIMIHSPSVCVAACMCVFLVSLIISVCVWCVCDRKHAGVVSPQRHGPGGSGVQGHRQRLPPSHHRLYVSMCVYANKQVEGANCEYWDAAPCFPSGRTERHIVLPAWHSHLAGSLPFLTHALRPSLSPPASTDTSGRATTSAWPALPTWRWRARWRGGRGWSRWGSCLLPTRCSTATWASWSTRSGKKINRVDSALFIYHIMYHIGYNSDQCAFYRFVPYTLYSLDLH